MRCSLVRGHWGKRLFENEKPKYSRLIYKNRVTPGGGVKTTAVAFLVSSQSEESCQGAEEFHGKSESHEIAAGQIPAW